MQALVQRRRFSHTELYPDTVLYVATRAERQAETRAALIEAAGELFVERGFQGASPDAIASRAGYTRGAFYSNFASKEELFAELLQQRVYDLYRDMARETADAAVAHRAPTPRETGERLAAIQAAPEGHWLFRLWLELLAHAGRDESFRAIAAGFWSATRTFSEAAIQAAFDAAGVEPPAPARDIASAMIALDIGLALQHFVDPEAVPLDVYPTLYDLAFGGHAPQ
jgi:AcrR family transcriptional regulator